MNTYRIKLLIPFFLTGCNVFTPLSSIPDKTGAEGYSVKAVSKSYMRKKIEFFVSEPGKSPNLLKEIRYLNYKDRDLLKNVVSEKPELFTAIDENPLIMQEKLLDPVLLSYLNYINPFSQLSPVALAADNVTQSSFQARWSGVTGATGYKLYINNDPAITLGNVTSHTISNLPLDSSHTYYVQAITETGTSTDSNSISVSMISGVSCKSLKQQGINTSGTYYIKPGSVNIQVRCDMTTNSGGWTLVAAQYESAPAGWNQGVPAAPGTYFYSSSFTLSAAQLPPDRTMTGFGQGLTANGIDYVDFVYTTGNIAKTASLRGKKNTSSYYHIHRNQLSNYTAHNPEEALEGEGKYNNTLTFDKTGGRGYTWAFSPLRDSPANRGYAYNEALHNSSQAYAWTVWVK